MFRKSVLLGVFVAAMMALPLGGSANAAQGERAPSFACQFLRDIHKEASEVVSVDECLKCVCVFGIKAQTGWKVVLSWEGDLTDIDEQFTCDDETGQADFAEVQAVRFVRLLPDGCDPEDTGAAQCDCIRGKEDLVVTIEDEAGVAFTGTGIGVVGVGLTLKDELCCNIDENQAILHLRGSKLRHDKKKCWARLKYFSRINPIGDELHPCNIDGEIGEFEFNGMEGCNCRRQSKECFPVFENSAEVCNDRKDNDCDGLVDCADPDCDCSGVCPETNCTDNIDNDCDGKIDGFDSDCE